MRPSDPKPRPPDSTARTATVTAGSILSESARGLSSPPSRFQMPATCCSVFRARGGVQLLGVGRFQCHIHGHRTLMLRYNGILGLFLILEPDKIAVEIAGHRCIRHVEPLPSSRQTWIWVSGAASPEYGAPSRNRCAG